MIAQTTHVLGEFRVARRRQSGIAVGAKILGGIKTESSRRAQGSDAPIAPGRANSLCGIFDNRQVEFVREVLQRIHVCALPVEVHGQKGTQSARRGGAKLCFELRGVDVERVWVDVHQQRPRAGAHDGVDRGEKAERGRDDHIARFDANRKKRQP